MASIDMQENTNLVYNSLHVAVTILLFPSLWITKFSQLITF